MCFKTDVANPQYGPTQEPTPEVPTGRPDTVSRETKLGKLAKVLTPVIFGGLAGGFGGPGAADRMFAQQDQRDLQSRQLARQAEFDRLATVKAQDELNAPRYQSGSPYEMIPEGQTEPGLYERDPYLGTPRRIGKPVPKAPADTRIDVREGGKGIYGIQTSGPNAGRATPIMVTDPNAAPAQAPEYDPFGREEAQPQPPTIPLTPPVKPENTGPDAYPVTDTDASGVSTTHLIDKNTKSKTFGQDLTPKPVATRHPKPEKTSTKPKSEDIEQFAQEALKAVGNDGDKAITRINGLGIPDELKNLIRNRIREIKRPGQPKQPLISREDLEKMAQGVQ